MAGKDENRLFVGGLSWNVTERKLYHAFSRFGKIIQCQIVSERDTGRPRGFGFITYADRRGMEDAIRGMHGQEFGDRVITVNKAQPKMKGEDLGDGPGYWGGAYYSSGRRSYGGGDRSAGLDQWFKCGHVGHWACESFLGYGDQGGGRGSFSSRSRFGRGGRHEDHFTDDRDDGGRYGDTDHFDSREEKYRSCDQHHVGNRQEDQLGDQENEMLHLMLEGMRIEQEKLQLE